MRRALRKLPLLVALLAAGTTAYAGVTFQNLGTAAPPATLGGYAMTAFADDLRPVPGSVTTVPSPTPAGGNVTFNITMGHADIPIGWATWSHGYTGDVYSTTGTSVTMTMPANTAAFYFYAEPNIFNVFTMTATTDDGTTSGPIAVNGTAGANGFGFYGTGGSTIVSITVTAPAAASGFAVGEFGINQCPHPVINLSETAIELAAPNHNYHTINVTDFVTSVVGCVDIEDVVITEVSSDEPDNANGNGDGNTTDDIVIADDCQSVDLRAERAGGGNGRVYRIYVSVTDDAGNEGTASFPVSVRKGADHVAVEGTADHSVTSDCAPSQPKLVTHGSQYGFSLMENYPNPFNATTVIPYTVGAGGEVRLTVVDATGGTVAMMVENVETPGEYTMTFNGSDLPSGTYYYVLEADGQRLTRSMVLSK